jgi:hypothetical protein
MQGRLHQSRRTPQLLRQYLTSMDYSGGSSPMRLLAAFAMVSAACQSAGWVAQSTLEGSLCGALCPGGVVWSGCSAWAGFRSRVCSFSAMDSICFQALPASSSVRPYLHVCQTGNHNYVWLWHSCRWCSRPEYTIAFAILTHEPSGDCPRSEMPGQQYIG